MTLRTLVACASPLANGHTVREHLAATSCEQYACEIIIENVIINNCDATTISTKPKVAVVTSNKVYVKKTDTAVSDSETIQVGKTDITVKKC